MRLVVGLACGALVACNLISGVDEFEFGGGGAGASVGNGGRGGTGAGSSNAGAGGAGGAPTCELTQKVCGDSCVALDDPAFGCDAAGCGACEAGSSCCPDCTPTSADPKRCGECNHECDKDEWCEGSQCVCRPGLEPTAGGCVDPMSNPADCGGKGPCGGGTPVCQQGVCVTMCTGSFTACGDACVDLSSDPLHCGACTASGCDVDKLCVDGGCEEYQPATGCSACPCSACSGDFDRCCIVPATSTPVCLSQDASSCP